MGRYLTNGSLNRIFTRVKGYVDGLKATTWNLNVTTNDDGTEYVDTTNLASIKKGDYLYLKDRNWLVIENVKKGFYSRITAISLSTNKSYSLAGVESPSKLYINTVSSSSKYGQLVISGFVILDQDTTCLDVDFVDSAGEKVIVTASQYNQLSQGILPDGFVTGDKIRNFVNQSGKAPVQLIRISYYTSANTSHKVTIGVCFCTEHSSGLTMGTWLMLNPVLDYNGDLRLYRIDSTTSTKAKFSGKVIPASTITAS